VADDNSGASPSIADPLPQQQGFNATALLRKYWWEIALVVGVIAYLIYMRMNSNNSNNAQVGDTSTTAAAGPNDGTSPGSGMSAAGNDSNLVGMFSTQYQDMSNAIAGLTAAEAKENVPAPAPGTPAPPKPPAPKVGPKWYGPKANFAQHVREYLKLHPGSPSPVYGGLTAPKGGGKSAAPFAPFGFGGPPASGPKVPFGTYAGLFSPLTSSGDMYASSR